MKFKTIGQFKYFFQTFLLTIIVACLVQGCSLFGWKKNEEYKELPPDNVEKSLIVPDEEEQDYIKKGAIISPYPLIRLARSIEFEGKIIPPGFYLLKMYKEAGVDYILFKREARLVASIPIDEKQALEKKIKTIDLKTEFLKNNSKLRVEISMEDTKYTVVFNVL